MAWAGLSAVLVSVTTQVVGLSSSMVSTPAMVIENNTAPTTVLRIVKIVELSMKFRIMHDIREKASTKTFY